LNPSANASREQLSYTPASRQIFASRLQELRQWAGFTQLAVLTEELVSIAAPSIPAKGIPVRDESSATDHPLKADGLCNPKKASP
jgi:hypothetical protein